MRAKYVIVVSDPTDCVLVGPTGINFPEWVRACGAKFISLQQEPGVGAVLWIEGSQEAIDTFSKDISYEPQEVA